MRRIVLSLGTILFLLCQSCGSGENQNGEDLGVAPEQVLNYQVADVPEAEPFAMGPITLQTLSSFGDVPPDYWAYEYIETLYASGITGGCGGGNFCPDSTVTRAQMAVFLERGMRGSDYQPPPALVVFNDVEPSHWAADWIEQLYADGITGGCGNGNYCPASPVTRAQMAVFLERAMHWPQSFSPPAATGTIFGDVPDDYWAADWIEQLYADGITGGCGPSSIVTITSPDDTWPATINGNMVSWYRSYPESGGTVTETGNLTVSVDGTTLDGSTSWTFADIAYTCSGTTYLSGTHLSSGDISEFTGTWLITETMGSNTCGLTPGVQESYTVEVTQDINYCPDSTVTRAQMAVFLVRTFSLGQ